MAATPDAIGMVSVSRSAARLAVIDRGPSQPAGPLRWASKLAAKAAGVRPVGQPPTRNFKLMLRSPSASRRTVEARAKPMGAGGRVLRPKGGQRGAVLSGGAPRPSAELATGANSRRWPSRRMLASRTTCAWPTTVLRSGANSCSTFNASLPAVKRCSGVIARATAPFFNSNTRCARSGCGGSGLKPSTCCIWNCRCSVVNWFSRACGRASWRKKARISAWCGATPPATPLAVPWAKALSAATLSVGKYGSQSPVAVAGSLA